MPIEKEGKLCVYKISENKIIGALNNEEDALLSKIKRDNAIGNIAEVAFGVLGLYGIKGCGRVLLDEKLGMHIALGRSEHLGGTTGPGSFKFKEEVWHQDFVYTKEMQPSVNVKEVKLKLKDNNEKVIMKDNSYVIF